MVVDFCELRWNWVDGVTTTDANLDVIIGADDSSTKDDVPLWADGVRILIDDGCRADDDNDVMIGDVMTFDVFTPGDDCTKIKRNKLV